MATDVLVYNSRQMTATITMSSLVTLTTSASNCWQGNFLDFETPRAELWLARLAGAFVAAPTAGGTLELYMSWSSATATANNWPGGCTGADGAFPGVSAVPADGLKQLDFIGVLTACATGSTTQQISPPLAFTAKHRYGTPVVAMRTSQVLSSVSASHTLVFTDLRPQSQ